MGGSGWIMGAGQSGIDDMTCWLVKSEPGDWSWQDQQAVASEPWTGVRNHQAQKYMRAMAVGDRVFFYHSGKVPQIVGICTVSRGAYADPDDPTGKFILVDLTAKEALLPPISLSRIKSTPALVHLPLVRQPRLSVMPIDDASWSLILSLSTQ